MTPSLIVSSRAELTVAINTHLALAALVAALDGSHSQLAEVPREIIDAQAMVSMQRQYDPCNCSFLTCTPVRRLSRIANAPMSGADARSAEASAPLAG